MSARDEVEVSNRRLVPEASILERLAAGRFGPTRLALVLAAVSLPLVIISTPVYGSGGPPDLLVKLSPLSPETLVTLVPPIIVAALLAGTLGGWLERRRFRLGAVATFVLAWAIAIVALPMGPILSDLPGCCHVGYGLMMTNPRSGLEALVVGWWYSPIFAPVPFALLLLGVVAWARAVYAKTQAPRLPAFPVKPPSEARQGATPPQT